MSSASESGTSRCMLHDCSPQPRVEILLGFELLPGSDTQWKVDYRDACNLQFRARGFLTASQLQKIAAELKHIIDRKHGDVSFIDDDHAVRMTVHVMDSASSVSLELRCERHLDKTDDQTFRTSVIIDRLPLADAGLSKLYEWVRDWTRML